jgi:hypothetical protein
MNPQDEHDFRQWQQDWQAGQPRDTTEDEIRRYVKRRGRLVGSFMIVDAVIAGIALPILAYLGIYAQSEVERVAMIALAYITIAATAVGWWNWRAVRHSHAASTADYLAISAERLRRMRLAGRMGWGVLVSQVVVFSIWIWDQLYAGNPYDPWAERFAWSWLGGFTVLAVAGLVWFDRWLTRDVERFEALRRELGG